MANRYLGVDFGSKRIGLAVADAELLVAQPLKIIQPDHIPILEQFKQVIAAHDITDIVLGLPRGLDGQDTQQTEVVRRFGRELETLGLPVHWQDEAATSDLVRQHHPGARRIDDAAAAVILRDFLESQ